MRDRDREEGRDPFVRPVLFLLGRTLATPGVLEHVPPSELQRAMRRHARGDWGDLDDQDRGANERALKADGRLLSSYKTTGGQRGLGWSDAYDRSATTALFPDEY